MQSTFIMPDEEVTLKMSYFTKTSARADADILRDRVIFTKDKQCSRVSI